MNFDGYLIFMKMGFQWLIHANTVSASTGHYSWAIQLLPSEWYRPSFCIYDRMVSTFNHIRIQKAKVFPVPCLSGKVLYKLPNFKRQLYVTLFALPYLKSGHFVALAHASTPLSVHTIRRSKQKYSDGFPGKVPFHPAAERRKRLNVLLVCSFMGKKEWLQPQHCERKKGWSMIPT